MVPSVDITAPMPLILFFPTYLIGLIYRILANLTDLSSSEPTVCRPEESVFMGSVNHIFRHFQGHGHRRYNSSNRQILFSFLSTLLFFFRVVFVLFCNIHTSNVLKFSLGLQLTVRRMTVLLIQYFASIPRNFLLTSSWLRRQITDGFLGSSYPFEKKTWKLDIFGCT